MARFSDGTSLVTGSPEPLSIEEQFKKQILGSLDKTFFKSEVGDASTITVSFIYLIKMAMEATLIIREFTTKTLNFAFVDAWCVSDCLEFLESTMLIKFFWCNFCLFATHHPKITVATESVFFKFITTNISQTFIVYCKTLRVKRPFFAYKILWVSKLPAKF